MPTHILDDLSAYEAKRAAWYWRPHSMGYAHRFVDTEPACGEPSGPEQWSKASALVPRCPGCLRVAVHG